MEKSLGYEELTIVYEDAFDINKLGEAQRKTFCQHTFYSSFPTALVIILHFITLSIFTLIYFGIQHSKLPIIKHDDFGGGKAIGFMFIPFFNFYWIFMFWIRLINRINFQLKLRNHQPLISKGFAIATIIIAIIPYVDLISYLIFMPIMIGYIQHAINKLSRI